MAEDNGSERERLRRLMSATRAIRENAIRVRNDAIAARQRARAVVDLVNRDDASSRSELVQAAFTALPTPAAIVGRHGLIVAANPPWRSLFAGALTVAADFPSGWEALGGDPFVADALRHVLEGAAGTDVEVDLPREPGRRALVQIAPAAPGVGAALIVILDVTRQYHREQQLLFEATHDALTGLANRGWLLHELNDALERQRRYGGRVGLVYLDLDAFKPVNDTYGHAVGDHLLREIARRWSAIVRAPDLLARVGGDEFVVLVPHLDDPSQLEALAGRLRRALAEPFDIGHVPVVISVTTGHAEPSSEMSGEDALAVADRAMYQAKRNRARGA